MGIIIAFYVTCFLILAIPAAIGLVFYPTTPGASTFAFMAIMLIVFAVLAAAFSSELRDDLAEHFRRNKKTQKAPVPERCIKGLDAILLTDGQFDYGLAMARLRDMCQSGAINTLEYCNLVDACNHRNEDGHYRNCLIYKRAA